MFSASIKTMKNDNILFTFSPNMNNACILSETEWCTNFLWLHLLLLLLLLTVFICFALNLLLVSSIQHVFVCFLCWCWVSVWQIGVQPIKEDNLLRTMMDALMKWVIWFFTQLQNHLKNQILIWSTVLLLQKGQLSFTLMGTDFSNINKSW